ASVGTFSGLAAALRSSPVVVEEHPLLSFESPQDWSEFDAALMNAGDFGAAAVTSPRAARALLDRLRVLGIAWNDSGPAIWAGGPGTAAELRDLTSRVRVPPAQAGRGSAESLARAMVEGGVAGPVLFACGEPRRDELPGILRQNGIHVREVVCYRSVLASRSEAGSALARGSMVVVASPSVMALVSEACEVSARPRLIAAGPTTAVSARAHGWPPDAVASDPSTEGVASAIRDVLGARS
ncbi:MAG TPA: uroporphyrinogen-III synthase, partial [Gemmatimonadales bacterium]|nr:uroporphyrinogen-III synthase [Gemmatimonadales bacterium]